MTRKKLVTDSLLQIALMLSLVRRHVDDYLSVLNGQYSDSELSDVFLGTTSAIAQTENYFSNWERSADGYVHPKNVERYMSDFYTRDIYSYRNVNRMVPARIEAYILPELQTRQRVQNIASHVDDASQTPQPGTSNTATTASSHTGADSLNLNWNNNLLDSNATLHGYGSDSDSGISDVNSEAASASERPGDELTLEVG